MNDYSDYLNLIGLSPSGLNIIVDFAIGCYSMIDVFRFIFKFVGAIIFEVNALTGFFCNLPESLKTSVIIWSFPLSSIDVSLFGVPGLD